MINGLRDSYNRGEFPALSTTDIHAICDLVKSWFRVLPEPLFPPSSYRDAMEAMRMYPWFFYAHLINVFATQEKKILTTAFLVSAMWCRPCHELILTYCGE